MKKLLVPIDYSVYADNAVKHAIQIAKTIKASVHLCHALTVPELSPQAGLVVWPLEDYSTIKADSDEKLEAYVNKLVTTEELTNEYLPPITYSSEVGTVKQMVDFLIETRQIDLVIMGMAGAGTLDRFFLGSNSRSIIENTKIPVLLIPKDIPFKPLHKLGFATDLSQSDINCIHHLAGLFCLYNPAILLVHINKDQTITSNPNNKVNSFLNLVTCKINYAKIYYRHVEESDIEKGLIWLSKNTQIDMLAMVHRKSSLYSRIVNGSFTQKMAKTTTLPLLVMPDGN